MWEVATQLQRNFRGYLFPTFHCLLVPFLLASWPFLIHIQHSLLAPMSTVWTYVISRIWNSLLLSIPWPRDTTLQTPAWLLAAGRSSLMPEDNISQLPTTHFRGSLFFSFLPSCCNHYDECKFSFLPGNNLRWEGKTAGVVSASTHICPDMAPVAASVRG